MQDVQDFIESLPKDERLIVRHLRDLILLAEPRVIEKLSYGVPYFSRHRRLFFLWPASALPNAQESESKVTLGFCYGNLLSNEQGLLKREGRKQVLTVAFSSLRDINDRQISEVLREAVMVDAQFFQNSNDATMATPLKYMFNPAFFEKLCPVLKDCIPQFDCRDFIVRIFNNQWPELELKQRVRHITTVLHQVLPSDFTLALRHITAISKHLEAEDRLQRFEYIFLPDYIEVYGLDYPDESLEALGEITRLVSAEFAVRPFLVRYPPKTLAVFYQWARSGNESVRRLSSEGCWPRLPWGIALTQFKKDPSPILPILEYLKEDPSLYVRKSVANNLNDISKDHPDVVIKLAKQWKGLHPRTDWIIRHGCRSLKRAGNKEAFRVNGFQSRSGRVTELLLPKKVKLGDLLNFTFSFKNGEKKATKFRLDYSIDYITASGKTSRKIFKIAENTFPPGEKVVITRKRSFKDFSTRKHFRGKHLLSIMANGKKLAEGEFIIS